MKSPAFQMYVNDFLGSAKVGLMSTETVGAYLLLLFLDWQEGGFVYNETDLARWCRLSPARFRKAWIHLGPCFVEEGGRLFSPRLKKERQKQAKWREKSAAGGKKSAETRWGSVNQPDNQTDNQADKGGYNGGDKGGHVLPITKASPKGSPFDNIPFPLPVTTNNTTPPARELCEGLLEILPEPRQRDVALEFLRRLPDPKVGPWQARLTTWLGGHDWPKEFPMTPEVLITALGEYVDADPAGDYSPPHVRTFVLRVIRDWEKRPARPAGPRRGEAGARAEQLYSAFTRHGFTQNLGAEEYDGMIEDLRAKGKLVDPEKFRRELHLVKPWTWLGAVKEFDRDKAIRRIDEILREAA